jgi:hypothetical protein
MPYKKNPAPRGESERGTNCQAAKLDAGNPATIRRALQAAPARRVTVDQHQAFRRAISPAPDFDDDGPDLDFIDRPPARRREREIARLLHILDTLPPARGEMEREGRK